MPVKLIKISLENWEDALDLKVSEDHKQYVASNIYSIAEGQFYPDVNAYGIYNDELMVGFTMYGTIKGSDSDDDDFRFWIWRLMVAEDQRGKGYGREATKLAIEEARSKGHTCVVLSTEPHNHKAIKLYESLGFKATGKIEDDEEEYILNL